MSIIIFYPTQNFEYCVFFVIYSHIHLFTSHQQPKQEHISKTRLKSVFLLLFVVKYQDFYLLFYLNKIFI